MELSQEIEQMLGDTDLYLEIHHEYAQVFDISSIPVKNSETPTDRFDAANGKNVVTRKPIATHVAITKGTGKDAKILMTGVSKCHPKDQFSRSEGRKKAISNMLYKKNDKKEYVYNKALRTAVWTAYWNRNEVPAVPVTAAEPEAAQ